MSTLFPAAKDDGTTLPNPSTTSYEDTLSHAAQHANANDAIKAVETKLGTSASTPSSGLILLGTGTGSSAWSQLTSAQLFALLADKTGSGGSAVFNTSPTLITPKVDTINEATLNNGVTVGGVNLKAGGIPASAIPSNGVTGDKLATSAISLGYAQITSNFSTASTTPVQVTSLSAAVTIPAGGRRVRISAYAANLTASSAPAAYTLTIWDGAVGSGVQLNSAVTTIYVSFSGATMKAEAITIPSAGSKTYNVGFQVSTGTGGIVATTTAPAFISVEAI